MSNWSLSSRNESKKMMKSKMQKVKALKVIAGHENTFDPGVASESKPGPPLLPAQTL